MEEASGVVQCLGERQASSGGTYVLLRLEGQDGGFFDWDGRLDQAGVDVGDEIAVSHTGGEYPRVSAVKRLTGGSCESASPAAEAGSPVRSDREIQIARMCALKAATSLIERKTYS